MTKMARLVGALGTMLTVAAFARPALAAEPVQITYGYHPYWTGAWYGVIVKNKELWKKYLPPGSTVKFEPHLTGPPMINAMPTPSSPMIMSRTRRLKVQNRFMWWLPHS